MRQELDLYVCLRPIQYFDGVPSPVKEPQKTNMVIFRENSEDIYAGLELDAGINVFRIFTEDHHIGLLGLFHGAGYAVEILDRTQTYIQIEFLAHGHIQSCLLYTSDAAD